ncbi:MAG: hypothetical protein QME51_01955, partial [Planctomycetota bacterium]|nr:hypothetical protein [Planctomycetota bacterium]
LKSTEQALAYGKRIAGKANEIANLEKQAAKLTDDLAKVEPTSQEAANIATQKQFVNEAIQEAKGIPKELKVKPVPETPPLGIEELERQVSRRPEKLTLPNPKKFITQPQTALKTVTTEINNQARRLADEMFNEDPTRQLIKFIKDRGGIKPTVGLAEEYKEIPIHLKNSRGTAGNEIADMLTNSRPDLFSGSEDDLIQRLKNIKVPQKTEFYRGALDFIEVESPNLVTQKKLLEALVRAGVGDTPDIITNAKKLSRLLGKDITPEKLAEMTKSTAKLEAEMAEITAKWEKGLSTQQQKKVVHVLRQKLNLSQGEYRDLLQDLTGKVTMSKMASNPMSAEQAETVVSTLKAMAEELPLLATKGQKKAILDLMQRRKLIPAQVRRLERLFEIRTPKQPMTMEQAGDLIEAIQKVPPARRGGLPSVPKRIAEMVKEFDEVKHIPEKPLEILTVGGKVETTAAGFDAISTAGVPLSQDPARKFFQIPIRNKVVSAGKESVDFAKKLAEVEKGVSPDNIIKIFRYGFSQDPRSLGLLAKMGYDPLFSIEPRLMAKYNWLHANYKTFLTRINAERQRNWLLPVLERKNYMPHIRDLTTLQEVSERVMLTDINKAITEAYSRNAPGFQFDKPRQYLLKKVETNPFEQMRKYAQQAIYGIHLTEPVARGRVLLKALNNKPRTQTFLGRYLDVASGSIRTSSGFAPLDMASEFLRANIPIATLSSVRSAVIQVSSLANTAAVANWGNLPDAVAFYGKFGDQFKNISKTLYVRSPELALTERSVQLDRLLLRKKGTKIKERITEAGYYGLKKIDDETAKMSWGWLYLDDAKRLRAEGKVKWTDFDDIINNPIGEAVIYADNLVEKGQASAAAIARSPIQQTELGKFLTTLQTFQIAQYNYWIRDVLGISRKMPGAVRAERLIKGLIAVSLFNMLFEDVIGMTSPFPRPIKTLLEARKRGWGTGRSFIEVAKEMGGELPLLGGVRYGTTLGGPTLEHLKDIAQKTTAFISEQPIPKEEYVPSTAELIGKTLGVPGTVQTGRIYKGITKKDKRFPLTTKERILQATFGRPTVETAVLRDRRWDIIRQIKVLEKRIDETAEAGKPYRPMTAKLQQLRKLLSGIEKELGQRTQQPSFEEDILKQFDDWKKAQ